MSTLYPEIPPFLTFKLVSAFRKMAQWKMLASVAGTEQGNALNIKKRRNT